MREPSWGLGRTANGQEALDCSRGGGALSAEGMGVGMRTACHPRLVSPRP